MRRIAPFAVIAICGLGAVAPAVSTAATTIGQTAPGITSNCTGATLYVSPSVANPPAYFVPSDGVLTQWSTKGGGYDSSLGLKVVRQTAPMNYRIVGSDGPRPVPANLAQFFPIRIPVSGGEYLALWVPSGTHTCSFVTGNPADVLEYRAGSWPEPNVGDTFNTDTSTPNVRTNVAARLEPDADHDGYGDETQDKCLGTPGSFNGCPSTVAIDSAKQKRTKPKVKVTATVPGAGTLQAGSANDASLAAASASRSLKAVSQTISSTSKQQVTLTLKLTKSAKKKLADKGKLKTKVKVVYTPPGGPAGSQTAKVKLKG